MSEALTTIIISILSGVNLIELLGFILYYRQNKKSKELENDGKAIDNKDKGADVYDKVITTMNKVIEVMEEKFQKSEEDSDEKATKIDQLLKEKEQLIQEKFTLLEDISNKKIECTKANILRCNCISCEKRQPPMTNKLENAQN